MLSDDPPLTLPSARSAETGAPSSEWAELGQLPRLGELPRRMRAAVIRRERYGPPTDAFRLEVVDVPPVGRGQVLVMVMAAGVNYNSIWAGLGKPLDVISERQRYGDARDFHIGGSDGSGIVWAVGAGVRQVREGDPVVLSGSKWDERAPDILLGADPVSSRSQRSWGYEANDGAFAQFAVVDEYQCHAKPSGLTWEAAGCHLVTGATAYRQLCGWPPHTVQPGDPVLIWGGAGGLGSMAIQIAKLRGGLPVAVVSTDERAEHCLRLGATGVIDRRKFDHWGPPPAVEDSAEGRAWLEGMRGFGRAFWEIIGRRAAAKIVLEHPGRDTLPTSIYMCDNAGMIVSCAATTGYRAEFDLRFLWMRQKRLQGSNYASLRECRAVTHLVDAGSIDPCLSAAVPFEQIGAVHQLMFENRHPPGQMAVLVNAPRAGLTSVPEGWID